MLGGVRPEPRLPCLPSAFPAPGVLQEQAYQRLSSLKKEQWSKNNLFYTNRSFSRNIRKVRCRRRRCHCVATCQAAGC